MGIELKGMAYEIDSGPGSRFLNYINDLANKLAVQAQGGALDLERARGQTTQPQQTPEDIDREVRRIQEAVKGEFRRA